jgi:putative ABC transport system permease protein
MLSRILSILRFTLEEFSHNKARTLLSLLGITIGIFCIISVLATTGSLEKTVKTELKSLGVNTVYIQKFPWGGGGPDNWWKYMNRPTPKIEELHLLKERAFSAENVAFTFFNVSNVEYNNASLEGVVWYAVTDEFEKIQDVEIQYGRYISPAEFNQGASVAIMGYDNAEKLFNDPSKAIGKEVQLGPSKAVIIGVTKKKGQTLMGGWDFDNIVLVSANFCRRLANFRKLDGFIMVQAKPGIAVEDLKGELRGLMRSIRRLTPKEEDDFALNDVTAGSDQMNAFFGQVSLGGWFIALLSLIVGAFGVANIMFVSVRERTSIIGLKKAIGAKNRTILSEFLIESAFLCIIGGLIGLLLVWPMTYILTTVFKFNVQLSWGNIILTLTICIILGVLSGIIPASVAARMNPVNAIRSK